MEDGKSDSWSSFNGVYVHGRLCQGIHDDEWFISASSYIVFNHRIQEEMLNVCAFPPSIVLQLLRAYFHLDYIRYTLPLIMFQIKKKITEIWIYFFTESCLLSSHYRRMKKVNECVKFYCVSILFIVLEHIISTIYHCRTLCLSKWAKLLRAAEELIYPRMPLLRTVENDRTFTL